MGHLTLGACFNMNIPSDKYWKFHSGDKTILRSSYLHNGISYTCQMTCCSSKRSPRTEVSTHLVWHAHSQKKNRRRKAKCWWQIWHLGYKHTDSQLATSYIATCYEGLDIVLDDRAKRQLCQPINGSMPYWAPPSEVQEEASSGPQSCHQKFFMST